MKNNFNKLIIPLLIYLLSPLSLFAENFNFETTEIQISGNGNIYKGINGGVVTTDDGVKITSENFIYNKITTILEAYENVIIRDEIKNINIESNQAFYLKDKEIIYTKGKSKAIDNTGIEIYADDRFEYNKLTNILSAKGNVKIVDLNKNTILYAEEIFYHKNDQIIYTSGPTKSEIENKYTIQTSDAILYRNEMILSSEEKTSILDETGNFYTLDEFQYLINSEMLKGSAIKIVSKLPMVDKNGNILQDEYNFENGFFDLSSKKFLAKDVNIKFNNEFYKNSENEPRLKGASGEGDEFNTYLEKGVFTSCKQNNDKCPPWVISAEKIHHDKKKKSIIYKNAWLKVYDIPVAYFPKFFHPDPSVVRQSGFLDPSVKSNKILGTSLYLPYFHVFSDNADMTFKPRIYDKDRYIIHNEFRKKTKNSYSILDFSFTNHVSTTANENKKTKSHVLFKSDIDLNYNNFLSSDLEIQYQKTSNDTYLKAFTIFDKEDELQHPGTGELISKIKLDLQHEEYDLTTSLERFESMSGLNSDRYQYSIPNYYFSKSLNYFETIGSLNLTSDGTNTLTNTNKVSTKISNNLDFITTKKYSNLGLVNYFDMKVKNLNSVGKNDNKYKSSPQSELMSMIMFNSSYPLKKTSETHTSTLNPKLSIMYSPHEMKNHQNLARQIFVDSIFNTNRLGLSDSFEEGSSLTLGLDYKIEKNDLIKIDKDVKNEEKLMDEYFEFKLGGIIRLNKEKNIPVMSKLNQKTSNLLGKATYNLSKNLKFDYNFSLDNDFNTFEYNSLGATITLNNLITSIDFIEENGALGDSNILENSTKYNFNENSSLNFKTRRNRKINLTEYYDLVYEYKNDCLIAGLKYNKKFYSDRDIKPTESLLFTITVIPLTTFEQSNILGLSKNLKNSLKNE